MCVFVFVVIVVVAVAVVIVVIDDVVVVVYFCCGHIIQTHSKAMQSYADIDYLLLCNDVAKYGKVM